MGSCMVYGLLYGIWDVERTMLCCRVCGLFDDTLDFVGHVVFVL